jgi:hypothetical protein
MKGFSKIVDEVARLEKVNMSAVDSHTEVAIRQALDALNWVLDQETASPFEALGLEEGIQS